MSSLHVFAAPRREWKTLAALGLGASWALAVADRTGGPGTSRQIDDYGQCAAPLLAAAACWVAGGRVEGRLRLFWRLVGASALSWGLGQVVWTWYEAVQGQDAPFPSLADVGYLGAVPLAVAAMLVLPKASESLPARLRAMLDGLIIAGSALLMSWLFILRDAFESGGHTVANAIGLAYPIGDVVVVTIVLYTLLGARRAGSRQEVPLTLIGIGFIAIAVADSAFTYLSATGAYDTGSLIDIGWFGGYVLLIVAALRPSRSGRGVTEPKAGHVLTNLLPYAAVAAALVTSSAELVRGGGADQFVSWLRTTIMIALICRQILILYENASLTRTLEGRVDDLRASEQRFEALVLHSSDVVSVVDPDSRVVYQSESMQRVFGHPAESLVGRPLTSILAEESAARLRDALARAAAEPGCVRVLELEVRRADGLSCNAEMTVTNLLDDASVSGIVLNTRDISERKSLQEQLAYDAFHDSLTRLANRALFRERVESDLRANDVRSAKLTVLFLDLDGFKEVNDSLGHATGDTLLIQVAERLRSCVRPVDTVARLGGDEFAILLADRSRQRNGTAVAQRIGNALAEPFLLEGREIYVGASIGIAATDEDVDDADHLLRNADLAMYRAKAAGGGSFERYHPGLRDALVDRLQLESDLRQALAERQLQLHYQPTVDLGSGELKGIEALARWKHARRGFVPPVEFVPLAEQTGLIRKLGLFVLGEATGQLAAWQDAYPEYGHLTVSVNISGRHLEDARLIDDVQEALTTSGLRPECLVLEMTESVLMAHTAENVELLGRLKQLGVGLAIDDFGTGYSSLAYLHRFPADVIKIDRSFVERLGSSDSDAELLRTIVQLGQSLRMITVAEGVERASQARMLRAMGCELAQGFHFHRPLAPERLQRLLRPTPEERAA